MTDFHVLYERYAPQVRRFALFLCGDPALADDITSETFVRVWTSSGSIRQDTVKAYLFTIARNLHRDSARRARAQGPPLSEALPAPGAGAHHDFEVRTQLRMVLAAMQQLPEIDRAALLMRAQEQMSYEQIARALGLTLSAVKVKIHRSRRKLMEIVERPGTVSTRPENEE